MNSLGPQVAAALFTDQQKADEAWSLLVEADIPSAIITDPGMLGKYELAVMVERGDHVSPGVVVVSLLDTSRIEIPIRVPGGAYETVKVGADVHLHREQAGDISSTGVVSRIAASIDTRTRTFAVYVEVDNSLQDEPLVPGTFVQAQISGAVIEDALPIPRAAIRHHRVMVIDKNVIREVPVKVTRLIDDHALALSSLKAGDMVAMSHLNQLADGMVVRLPSDVAVDTDEGSPEPAEGVDP